MIRLCKWNDDAGEHGEFEPITLNPFKTLFYKLRSLLFDYLDRDTKHAKICNWIHRHKLPKRENYLDLRPRYCLRCKAKIDVLSNLMIELSTPSYEDWKNYCKIVDLPSLITDEEKLKK